MARVRDLLYQLTGSAMAEREIADELRTDPAIVLACMTRLGDLEIVQGPLGDERMWSAVPHNASFDAIVTKAKAGGVDLRDSLPEFVARPTK